MVPRPLGAERTMGVEGGGSAARLSSDILASLWSSPAYSFFHSFFRAPSLYLLFYISNFIRGLILFSCALKLFILLV